MKATLNRLFNQLLKINNNKNDINRNFTEAKFEDNRFSFKYLEGVFYIIPQKSSSNPNLALLKVYHDTNLPHSTIDDIKEVPEFLIQIELHSGIPYLYIKNFVDFTHMGQYQPTLVNGFLHIKDEDAFADTFVIQFDRWMSTNDFTIYPV